MPGFTKSSYWKKSSLSRDDSVLPGVMPKITPSSVMVRIPEQMRKPAWAESPQKAAAPSPMA